MYGHQVQRELILRKMVGFVIRLTIEAGLGCELIMLQTEETFYNYCEIPSKFAVSVELPLVNAQ